MPFGQRLQPDSALQGRRARLYDLILDRPGITFLGLVRASGCHYGATAHHLHVLERFGLVHSYKTGRNRRYYGVLGGPHSPLEAMLQESHYRETQDLLKSSPALTQTEMAQRLGVGRQAVAYRLKALAAAARRSRSPY